MRLAAPLLAAMALAGCNAAAPRTGMVAPVSATQTSASRSPITPITPITPTGFRLPDGAGCAGEVARFRAVIDNDLATGHVGRAVHRRVSGEIGQADSACAAGREAEANGLIRGAKARHGYR